MSLIRKRAGKPPSSTLPCSKLSPRALYITNRADRDAVLSVRCTTSAPFSSSSTFIPQRNFPVRGAKQAKNVLKQVFQSASVQPRLKIFGNDVIQSWQVLALYSLHPHSKTVYMEAVSCSLLSQSTDSGSRARVSSDFRQIRLEQPRTRRNQVRQVQTLQALCGNTALFGSAPAAGVPTHSKQ